VAYEKNNWRTPDSLFSPLNDEFNFGMDAAASHGAGKVEVYIPPEVDSLATDWREYASLFGVEDRFVWLNPPFNQSAMDIVMVCDASVGTQWFYALQEAAAQVRFTVGRVGFIQPDTGEVADLNMRSQAVLVFSNTRTYKDKYVWFHLT